MNDPGRRLYALYEAARIKQSNPLLFYLLLLDETVNTQVQFDTQVRVTSFNAQDYVGSTHDIVSHW